MICQYWSSCVFSRNYFKLIGLLPITSAKFILPEMFSRINKVLFCLNFLYSSWLNSILVQNLLKQSYIVPDTPETENDLRSIAEALFESVKDKNVMINHQRKTNKILANRVAELEKLLSESKLSKINKSLVIFLHWFPSDQTSSIINLLDRSPTSSPSDNVTSQFVNSLDDQQQTSPTQILTFSPAWATSPPLSSRLSEDDSNTKTKTMKYPTPILMKNTLECHQSRNLRKKSESIELEMDDPLQSPTLANSIAYLAEQDLIPPKSPLSESTEQQQQQSHDYSNLTC